MNDFLISITNRYKKDVQENNRAIKKKNYNSGIYIVQGMYNYLVETAKKNKQKQNKNKTKITAIQFKCNVYQSTHYSSAINFYRHRMLFSA